MNKHLETLLHPMSDGSGLLGLYWTEGPCGLGTEPEDGFGVGFFGADGELLGAEFFVINSIADHQTLRFEDGTIVEVRVKGRKLKKLRVVRPKKVYRKKRVTASQYPKAEKIVFNKTSFTIVLSDGDVVSRPLSYSPRLLRATRAQRARYKISGGGTGIHWPDIDEDLSVSGIIENHPCTARIIIPKKGSRRSRSSAGRKKNARTKEVAKITKIKYIL